MSSFLPNIIVTQAVTRSGAEDHCTIEASLQEKIRAGLDRLYHFQHEDGGWGWWETDETPSVHDRLRGGRTRRRPRPPVCR